MHSINCNGVWKAVIFRPRNAEGFSQPGRIGIIFFHLPGSTILPQNLRVEFQFNFGRQEEWGEFERTLVDGRILTVYLQSRAEPSLGSVALETGKKPQDIPEFTVKANGLKPLCLKLDPHPEGLEYRPRASQEEPAAQNADSVVSN